MPDVTQEEPVEAPPKRSYYYDDATGYEDYDPAADDGEDEAADDPSEEPDEVAVKR